MSGVMIDDHPFYSGVAPNHPGSNHCLECGEHLKDHTRMANCTHCGDGQVAVQ